jgi:parvulin-like peptidyl-prolyl isomerase
LALVAFGALFVILFAGYAIAQGIGQPSVPSGAVAIVTHVPSDTGTITEAEFKRALLQQVTAGKLKKLPASGSKKFEELKKAALGELLDAIWIQGEAEELGITATDKQIATELAQIKKTNFKTEAAYQEFLKTSHFTPADVDKRVKLQVLSTKIQEQILKGIPPVSGSEIAEKYEETAATQYTTKPSRDVRLVINKDKGEVEAALKQLEKDDSAASWKKVAKKYSSDPTSSSKGGLQAGLTEEVLATAGPLKGAIFGAASGEVVGPVKFQTNYVVFEVEKLNLEKVQPLSEVRSQISTQLAQEKQQAFFSEEFVSGYQSKWQSRTYCASGFVTERCANFKGSGHPASAPPACYEANPKTPATECPAPVEQVKPAVPGTVTILKPKGEALAQRPQPEGLKPASEEAAALPEGVPPGATEAAPPTGE